MNRTAAVVGHRRQQTTGEAIANSVSHGVALVAVLAGTPFLILQAVRTGSPGFVVGVSMFSITMALLYLASGLYHALPGGRAKRVFQVLDHSAIFLLIAGTCTPFSLGVLNGPWGWVLFGMVWTLAALGVWLKSINGLNHPMLSTGLYLLMGWLVVIAIVPLQQLMAPAGLVWLAVGGLAYTGGVVFFALGHRLRYGHFIWRLFVISGTACHFLAVFWYAAGT